MCFFLIKIDGISFKTFFRCFASHQVLLLRCKILLKFLNFIVILFKILSFPVCFNNSHIRGFLPGFDEVSYRKQTMNL